MALPLSKCNYVMLKVTYESIPTLVQTSYEYTVCPFYLKTRDYLEHYGRWKITFEKNVVGFRGEHSCADIYFILQRL